MGARGRRARARYQTMTREHNATGLRFGAWERLLRRWSTAPDCPERDLAIAVVVGAIVGDGEILPLDCPGSLPAILVDHAFRPYTTAWICMLGIDPQVLFDAVDLCWALHGNERAGLEQYDALAAKWCDRSC